MRPRERAAVVVGALFGVAHLGGGVTYVVLSAIAGFGYGWVYATSGSIGSAIAAHAGLNTIHFLFFTDPAIGT